MGNFEIEHSPIYKPQTELLIIKITIMLKIFLQPLIFSLWLCAVQAQNVEVGQVYLMNRELVPYPLAVGYEHTSHLIFPSAIKYVDLGNTAIIAQKPEGVENILRLKANQKYFQSTNLTVVTSDGKFYPFKVIYQDHPDELTISFLTSNITSFSDVSMHSDELEKYSSQIVKHKKNPKLRVKDKAFQIHVRLNQILIKDDVLFFDLFLHNQSTINFEVDFIRFYIRDKKIAKRTSVQETEQIPFYVYHPSYNPDKVYAQTSQHQVFALEKFTIPDKKLLQIEVFEKHGGRHLALILDQKDLNKAGILSGLKP